MANIINKVKEDVEQLMSKYSSGGYLSPSEYDNYAELAQLEKLTDDLRIDDTSLKNASISAFKATTTVGVVDGVLIKPEDYLAFDTARFNDFSSGTMIPATFEELTNDEFNFRLGSASERPNVEFPALTDKGDELTISPQTIKFIDLTYIKIPPKPTWNFEVINNRREYTDVGTVDFLYSEEDIPNLVFRISRLLGIEISDREKYEGVAAETVNKE